MTVNVNDYGADPTGVKDSTKAFKNAFAECRRANTRRVLFEGTYILSETLDATEIMLEGPGQPGGAHLRFRDLGDSAKCISFAGSGWRGMGGIRYCTIWADKGSSNAIGVYAAGDESRQPDEFTLEHVGFSRADPSAWYATAIWLDGSARKSPLGIRQAFIRDVTTFYTMTNALYAKTVQHLVVDSLAAAIPVKVDGMDASYPSSTGARVYIDGISSPFAGPSYGCSLRGLLLGGPLIMEHAVTVEVYGQVSGLYVDYTSDYVSGHIRNSGTTHVNHATHSSLVTLRN